MLSYWWDKVLSTFSSKILFPLQEARHQNEEMKKKKEAEERKAQALAEVKKFL